jgi:hypothetical protein
MNENHEIDFFELQKQIGTVRERKIPSPTISSINRYGLVIVRWDAPMLKLDKTFDVQEPFERELGE